MVHNTNASCILLRCCFVVAIALVLLVDAGSGDFNPYKVLNVARNADDKQIRNAYRRLAKDWHPDKNKAPEAHERFMQINQAYEILSDAERRSLYDDYGSTAEPREGANHPHHHQHHHGHQHGHHEGFFRDFEGFESFFGGGGGGGGGPFRFNQQRERVRKSQEEQVNKKIFEESVLPNSHSKPFMIYMYTEFCFSCMSVEPLWAEFKRDIKNAGFGVGHADASWNREMAKNLGITSVPSIVGVVNGRTRRFRGEFTLRNLREFARQLVAYARAVQPIVATGGGGGDALLAELRACLSQAVERDNKPLALFVHVAAHATLRFQVPCLQLTGKMKCASLRIADKKQAGEVATIMRAHFRVDVDVEDDVFAQRHEMLLVFKERKEVSASGGGGGAIHAPVHVSHEAEMAYETVVRVLEANKHLHLPRLSSLHHLLDLCTTSDHEREWCVLVVAQKSTAQPDALFDAAKRTRLLRAIDSHGYLATRATFVYVFADVQTDFVERMRTATRKTTTTTKKAKKKTAADGDNDSDRPPIGDGQLVALRRLGPDEKRIQFDMMMADGDAVDIDDEMRLVGDESDAQLRLKLDRLAIWLADLESTPVLRYNMNIPHFYDESFQSAWLTVLFNYATDMWSEVWDIEFWERLFANSSYMMILVCTVLFVWLVMLFSSDKSNPTAATASRKEARNSAASTPPSASAASSPPLPAHKTVSASSSWSATAEQVLELKRSNYADVIENPLGGKVWRTVLLVMAPSCHTNIQPFIRMLNQLASKYSRSYQLRFAYVVVNTATTRRWYANLLENGPNGRLDDAASSEHSENENDSSSSSSVSVSSSLSSSSSSSSDQDYEKIEGDEASASPSPAYGVHVAKLVRRTYSLVAFNYARGYFVVFHPTTRRGKSAHVAAPKSSSNNLMCNWLERFAEGSSEHKCHVSQWPRFS